MGRGKFVNVKLSSRYLLDIERCEILLLNSIFGAADTALKYREKVHGVCFKWRSEISLEASVQAEELWQV